MLAGLFLYALEIFVPSAGILFFTATFLVIWSVITAFQLHWITGLIFLATTVGLALVLPGVGFQLWRRSPIGRQMFLPPKTDEDTTPASPYEHLVGAVGKALTTLR